MLISFRYSFRFVSLPALLSMKRNELFVSDSETESEPWKSYSYISKPGARSNVLYLEYTSTNRRRLESNLRSPCHMWHHEFVAVGDASPRHGANTYATQRGMSEIRTQDYIPDCSDLVPAALECFLPDRAAPTATPPRNL